MNFEQRKKEELMNIVARGFTVRFGVEMKFHKPEAEWLVDELWSFISQSLSDYNKENIEKIIQKYEKAKKEKPFVHKMLGKTARDAYERHQGFLSGLLVAKEILNRENNND